MNDTIEQKVSIIEKEMEPIVKRVSDIVVKDTATYTLAGEGCKSLTQMEKRIKEYWKEDIDRAHKTHKSLCAKQKEMLDIISPKKALLVQQMKAWDDEQKRIAEEAEKKANEEARRLAEEAALKEAEELEKEGKVEEAEAVINEPIEAPPVVIQKATPKGYGAFIKENWYADVFDVRLLAKAVIDGIVPAESIQGNQTFLNNQARVLKQNMKYPGVSALKK